jgi:hypothetical protein
MPAKKRAATASASEADEDEDDEEDDEEEEEEPFKPTSEFFALGPYAQWALIKTATDEKGHWVSGWNKAVQVADHAAYAAAVAADGEVRAIRYDVQKSVDSFEDAARMTRLADSSPEALNFHGYGACVFSSVVLLLPPPLTHSTPLAPTCDLVPPP